MRKLVFLLFIVTAIVSSLFLFPSCKQCNSSAHADNTDTVGIPKLAELNAEIEKDSMNPFLYYKRAQVYEANNDFKSAATDMFIALNLDSLRPEFYMYAAELFKKTGDLKRGLTIMQKAIYTDSMNTTFYVKAAEFVYIDTTIPKHYQVALDYLNAAIAKDPQNADIYFYKGNIFKAAGDTIKALSSFQTATELNPKHYNAFYQIGVILESRKDKNAEKYLDNAIKVSDKPIDALYAKANMLKVKGVKLYDADKIAEATEQLGKAIEQYKKIVELDHKDAEACVAIGFCYYQMDSTQQAYKYYDLAIKIDPTHELAYFSKGLCAEDMGRKKEAIDLYQTCLNINPDFERAQKHLDNLKATQ